MRPVVKSNKNNVAGQPLEYKPWGNAKPDLINEIGSYCSYCEKKVNRSSLHVEHIKGQKVKNDAGDLIYDGLKYSWDNFLLACCNCNSIKNNKNIALTNPFMPHQNNLLHFIESGTGGMIKIKNGVNEFDLTRTTAFINLVGLDREPSHPNYSDNDDRWESRLEAKDIAERQYQKYTTNPKQTDIETIVVLAKSIGYFSVWYYQFSGLYEVLHALIDGVVLNEIIFEPFKGTHRASFHAPNYITLNRP